MIIQKQKFIKELAQDFLKPPRVFHEANILSIIIDYETEKGTYSEKKIEFFDVADYRHIPEENTEPEVMEAYNYICLVIDSEWLIEKNISNRYKHYMIYFDEYGTYEIIAKKYKY